MTRLDADRRAVLSGLKLGALVRDHLGRAVGPAAAFGGGAALIDAGVAWVLLDGTLADAGRGVGSALAWMSRQEGVRSLALVTDGPCGILARRASLFATSVAVYRAVDRTLVAEVPEPYPPVGAIPPAHAELRELIVAGGAEPVEEYGVLLGEVSGLEVCRVVTDPGTGEVRVEVGVGAHDREAFLLLHGARPTVEQLRDVVRTVAAHRCEGAAPHPLNRFGAERLLRARVVTAPNLIGARQLAVAMPPVPRTNIKDAVPCVAAGKLADGRSLVAVFSTGIDLELVPFALDARAMLHPAAALALVVPARDASPITAAVAAMAIDPPSLLGL